MSKNKENKENKEIIISKKNDIATLIFSHGLGDSPTSWIYFANEIKKYINNIRIILLSAPNNPVSVNNGLVMPSWFDILEIPISITTISNDKYIDKSIDIIHKTIDSEIKKGIPPNKIFIGGFSQGARLSLISSVKYKKETLGGIIILSGWISNNNDLQIFDKNLCIKNIPIFIGHGDKDNIVLYENAINLENKLKNFNFVNITLKTYNNMKHNSSNKVINDLIFWLNRCL